jgi:integrase
VAAGVARWRTAILARVDLARVTQVEYSRVVGHLTACAGDQPIASLDLASYVVARREQGAAPRTIKLEVRVASIFFRWVQEEGLVAPFTRLRVPRIKIDPNRFVLNHNTPTPAEAGRAIATMSEGDWKLAALLLARTGARIGEIVSVRSCDLDLRTGRLALGAVDGASKTGLRWFPLDDASLTALAARSGRGDAPLLDFDGARAPIQGLLRRIRQACADGGVPTFTPHGLRRMVVGRLLRAGAILGRPQSSPGTRSR